LSVRPSASLLRPSPYFGVAGYRRHLRRDLDRLAKFAPSLLDIIRAVP
jgi:hypothetical protein